MPRRLVAYYAGLLLLTVAVTAAVVAAGDGVEAQPGIAGTYRLDGPAACLGPEAQLRQSGQFVQLTGSVGGGDLRIRDDTLTGEITCADGSRQPLSAHADEGRLSGTLGDERFGASQSGDPPDPGDQPPRVPGSVEGEYRLTPPSGCLGARVAIEHGELVARGRALAGVGYRDGRLTAEGECLDGSPLRLEGKAAGREIALTLAAAEGAAERITAQRRREFGGTLAAFFIAVAVVMLVARLAGSLMGLIGQPRVMGEVAAGIALGPTLLGAIAPDAQAALFPPDIIPYLGVAANLGLIFYMFLVGLELDLGQLRGRVGQTAAISNTGVAVPMCAGMAIAVPVYGLVGPDEDFIGFALFLGVSMSITAFPVLARILVERRMLKRPVGALALASAAIDDISAWFLIALATAVVVAGSASDVVRTIALAIVFCLLMAFVARPLLARVSVAYDEAGRVPVAWVTAIFAGVLLAAYATEEIGIALIFGAFVMGLVMPRHAGLTEDVTGRLEDFVVLLLLPLFFAFTGLRTDVGLLDSGALVLLTLVLLVVAVACKFGGTMIAARVTGLGWRDSAVIGALMNTRGLTELIVLNLALEKGIISEALFASLVIMALVTTFMTGPILRLLDPRNDLGAPVEEELTLAEPAAPATPARRILVGLPVESALRLLVPVAAPLANSNPARELLLVALVAPSRAAAVRGGLQTQDFRLERADTALQAVRSSLLQEGVAARAAAFTSSDPGADLLRLSADESVDLLLLEGRRPLLGGGVPRGEVGAVLRDAPCDVAVLVSREDATPVFSGERPIVVPFGGAEHDWAALELGAWLCASAGAPLRLLAAEGTTESGRDASRLLAGASLLVQGFAGVPAEPVLIPPGREAVLEAAQQAGLLVIGLSDRWRDEGLGETRAAIAAAAPAPLLFVRRGVRAGALAPREDVTRFTWSTPGAR